MPRASFECLPAQEALHWPMGTLAVKGSMQCHGMRQSAQAEQQSDDPGLHGGVHGHTPSG
jgi:hypothetical protein